MTLQELLTSDSSPLSKQDKIELQEEYFTELNELNGQLRALKCEAINQSKRIERMEKEGDALVRQSVACLSSVKAMLQHSNTCGATHRMKGFYTNAMVKYIDRVIAGFDSFKIDGNLPF